ncbi:MAG: tRNA (adenosine(37)-N6)-threonylcarbamoyltransferase complex ATPase subunit type 1 TsaE [Thermoanaerobaculia bacterium]
MIDRLSRSPDETRELGEELAPGLVPDGVLLLEGELGAGKTVFAQGVARGLGIDPREVQSPTFTLLREHRGPAGRLIHVDLYRLAPEEIPGTAIEEALFGGGVKLVEWSERLPFEIPGARRVRLRVLDSGERRIEELRPDGSAPDLVRQFPREE